MAETGLQAIVVEPMQRGPLSWLEADDELGGQATRRTHADKILPVDGPEDATMNRDLGYIAPGICKARFWPFRTGGIGPLRKEPVTKKIQRQDSARQARSSRRSRRPRARKTRDKRPRSGVNYSRLGSAPL